MGGAKGGGAIGIRALTAMVAAFGSALAACLMLLNLPVHADDDIEDAVIARVGGDLITLDTFEQQFEAGIRQRFYHGRVPRERLLGFRKELLQSMIDRRLLETEARRHGIEADMKRVEAAVERIGSRYEGSALWRERGDALKVSLREGLIVDDLIDQLRDRLDSEIAEPGETVLHDYYLHHADRFTTPERLHVSLILLKVDPWAPESTWQAALREAEGLRQQLATGASFAELARLHSADASAGKGGDLGYIHRGMLSPEAEDVIDGLEPGEISAPLRLLKGIALFRLEERQPPQRNAFAHVRDRVHDLWLRDERQRHWQRFVERLRAATPIEVDQTLLNGVGAQ